MISSPAGSGVAASKALRQSSTSSSFSHDDESTKHKDRNQIRVCTYYFKGNADCLRRCIHENNWLEEKEEHLGRCVYVW